MSNMQKNLHPNCLIVIFRLSQRSFSNLRDSVWYIFLAYESTDYFDINKFCDVFGLTLIFAFLLRRKESTNPTVGKDECSRRRRRKTIKRELARLAKQLTAVNSTDRLARTCIYYRIICTNYHCTSPSSAAMTMSLTYRIAKST